MENREQSNRYLHMTLSTNPVPNECNALFPTRSQAVVVFEDLGGDSLADFRTLGGAG
jgi:hypothetical protein